MLSKFQANAVADALLDNAESRRLGRLNAAAQPVSWLNRCPEINPLQPWQRELVVQVLGDALIHSCWLGCPVDRSIAFLATRGSEGCGADTTFMVVVQ
jgi:hypothetical protein